MMLQNIFKYYFSYSLSQAAQKPHTLSSVHIPDLVLTVRYVLYLFNYYLQNVLGKKKNLRQKKSLLQLVLLPLALTGSRFITSPSDT